MHAPAEADTDLLSARLVQLRALCQLVATGGRLTRTGSITVNLHPDAGPGIDLLRAAASIAAEFGVHEGIQLENSRGTIHIWREDERR